jgi:nitrate reductase delta subunit
VYKDVDGRDKPGYDDETAMLGFIRKSPARSDALERVRDWTRLRFALGGEDTVMVSEIACAVPGCPPVETHVVFWTIAGRHHFKIFKPLAETAEEDLPPAFMKKALTWAEGLECACC